MSGGCDESRITSNRYCHICGESFWRKESDRIIYDECVNCRHLRKILLKDYKQVEEKLNIEIGSQIEALKIVISDANLKIKALETKMSQDFRKLMEDKGYHQGRERGLYIAISSWTRREWIKVKSYFTYKSAN